MKFAKTFQNLTACIAVILLSACVSSRSSSDLPSNQTEAMKARVNLALAYLEEKNFPKAKQNIDKALAHDSNNYLPYSVLAYYYQQTGDVDNAFSTYEQAVTLSQKFAKNDQPRPDVLNNYGTFLCKQQQYQQAYAQFEQALQSDENYYHQADTLENIVLCAKMEGDKIRARETLIQLERLDPERAKKLKFMR